MSRIDELIGQYCPDGVRFIELQELFNLKNGYTPTKANISFWSGGTVPWFRMEDIREHGGVLDSAIQSIPEAAVKGGRLFPPNSLLVATSATIGEHALVTVPHLSNQRFTSLSVKPEYSNQLDMKFAYYFGFVLDGWCRDNSTTSSFSSVDMSRLKRFKFPVPPLVVQREIVRILDKFSALEAELEAELEARRRQSEYYRWTLLNNAKEKARVLALGEIADLNWGDTNTTKESYVDEGGYLAFSAAGPDGRLDHFDYDRKAVILSAIGALSGKTWRVSGKWSCIKNTIRFFSRDEDVVLTDYLYWVTSTPRFWPRRGSAQPFISKGDANQVAVPVPSLKEQRWIIRSLDTLDALVNDLSVGLPAELAARRKQYEYYREKLLTFKEAAA